MLEDFAALPLPFNTIRFLGMVTCYAVEDVLKAL
jgi:hypothetical protein